MGAQGDSAEHAAKMKQVKAQREALAAERDAIKNSVIFKYQMTNLQQQQIQDKATVDVADINKGLVTAKGTASAAATSAGVEGNSVQALLNSFDVATGSDISTTYLQRDNEIAQSRAEQKGIEMDANNRMISLKHQEPIDPPSPSTKIMGRMFNAALQVGGAYAQYTTPVPKGETGGFMGRRFA